MGLEDVTLWLFAFCNSVRVLAYVPQIRKAGADRHGASAISCTTWSLFLIAHLSTVAYALVDRGDWGSPPASQATRWGAWPLSPSQIGSGAATPRNCRFCALARCSA